jgi:hypothetical protein
MINDKEARSIASLNDNYFLRPYVCTSCADSKRSVSDRWLINDKEGGKCRLFSICKMIMKRKVL